MRGATFAPPIAISGRVWESQNEFTQAIKAFPRQRWTWTLGYFCLTEATVSNLFVCGGKNYTIMADLAAKAKYARKWFVEYREAAWDETLGRHFSV